MPLPSTLFGKGDGNLANQCGTPENLMKWQGTKTKEEIRQITSKAGKASGKKKAERKLLREYLEEALSLINPDDGLDYYTSMTISLIKKASDGDSRSYEIIRDTLGQKPKDEVSLSSNDVINIKIGETK